MAAMVLNSPQAVEMSVYVVRAFVKLWELLTSNRELAGRFEQLEARVEKLVAHDQALGSSFPPSANSCHRHQSRPRIGRSDSPQTWRGSIKQRRTKRLLAPSLQRTTVGTRGARWVEDSGVSAIQAANVLNSPRAVETGIYVVRAFVKRRHFVALQTLI
jgi:hypothetical protein